MLNVSIRRKARQISHLLRRSALTPRSGAPRKPHLVRAHQMGVTFIGHSSFLVQIGGKNVLFDPNFALWLFILKRLRQPGLHVRDLPPIDVVYISHAHFDHLHKPSLRAIARITQRKSGRRPVIVVPRHVGELVDNLGYRQVIEKEWWQETEIAGLRTTMVPAQHWGARMLKDFHRGYGGYVVQSKDHSVYHAGDTAYFDGFREIGSQLRPQLAMLPIGAYQPASYRNVHTNPEDAVQAFQDLGSQWMVPMHYGSFHLGHEPLEEPLPFLQREAKKAGVQDRVLVMEEGTTRVFE